MSNRIQVSMTRDEAAAYLAAIVPCTEIPPRAPSNEQANDLDNLGVKIGAALLYQ